MSAPREVVRLVERFLEHRDEYLSPGYNEAQLRREFVDPFFRALDWDVDNEQGYAEAYKDVIHEDSIRIGDATKAPDYCFRIGGARKFFVETKKPAVNVRDDPSPAFQLRRYAWSAKLPLSILTDFEEFAVYDGRMKPARSDKASTARTLYLTCEQYVEQWDAIASIFSRPAILKGSFDRYAESSKRKHGTAEVDVAFLGEIEQWRTELARNLAIRNPGLSQRQLNEAVQKTIDRIIFLRICEDRGIERYGRLQSLLNGPHVYRRLRQLLQEADTRYNSGLFHFTRDPGRTEPPDEWTLDLDVDDRVLKDILRNLYYPESPYAFAVLGADILGQIYEQFLGKVIRLTAGHRALVEDKPEVKKAGGVYYTPTYVVDYIVESTVGQRLQGQTPQQIGGGKRRPPLTIVDPACGSGTFLIGAYQYLLDWYRDRYVEAGPAKHKRQVYRARSDAWHLTTEERKRILLTHLYGVDIDPQAVEVTKLSLLLKVLEGETEETIQRELFSKRRALPDLGGNIKCGNSLIAGDFHSGRLNFFDEDDRWRINAFDWNAEFRSIMQAGGFDVVVGNPPYVRQESLAEYKKYFQQHYEAFDGVADLYAYFLEKGVRLLRDGGLFSCIVSSSFLRATYGEPLRRTLKKHAAVVRIVDFGGLPVFANAKDTYVCIPLFAKGEKQKRVEVSKVDALDVRKLGEHVAAHHFTIPHQRLAPEAWSLKSDREAAVFAKVLKAGQPLGAYVAGRLFYGIKTGLNKAFVVDTATKRKLVSRDKRSAELIKPLLAGEDIRRYVFRGQGQWLIFPRRGVDIDRYPAIREHLAQWKEDLTPKRDKSTKRGRKPGRYQWYEIQDDVAYFEVFDQPKLIFPDIAKGPRFCLDRGGHYLANTAYCLGTDDLYLLGVLNSRLFWFAIGNISIPFGTRAGQYRYRLIYQYMQQVPIRRIDPSDRDAVARQGRIIRLVERMIECHEELETAKTGHEQTLIRRQIEATDRELDTLVFELYGLTEEEVEVVESSSRP